MVWIMSKSNQQARKISPMIEEINRVLGKVKSVWPDASKMAINAVQHSLDNGHSMAHIEYMLQKATDVNHKELLSCLCKVMKEKWRKAV